MEYTDLTDLEILTRLDRCEVQLLTPTQRFNCIRKIKNRLDTSRPPVINDHDATQWLSWLQSNFK
jgi:hypothetical protein